MNNDDVNFIINRKKNYLKLSELIRCYFQQIFAINERLHNKNRKFNYQLFLRTTVTV